jgi:hypothetical protein
MLTHQAFFVSELKKLIQAAIEDRKESLTTSHHAEGFDFSSFKHQIGIIEGLRLALQLTEDAETLANQR